MIRKFASAGDLIIGTGSTDLQASDRLVYWMRISDVTSFDGYWSDPRFARKKPNMNGNMMHRYGDNIYHTGNDGTFQQIDSFHSEDDGSLSVRNRERDTGKTEKVMLAADFAYFGKSAPIIPEHVRFLIKKGPYHKCRFSDGQRAAIEGWLETLPERGYVDEPGHW
ncbi:hypothetical protein X771_25570 [Mesorhizobium sp. LSJC277A00]|nr:hypothetical protein X771_25570 [Mesorhizobium sp. LSJC277A00]